MSRWNEGKGKIDLQVVWQCQQQIGWPLASTLLCSLRGISEIAAAEARPAIAQAQLGPLQAKTITVLYTLPSSSLGMMQGLASDPKGWTAASSKALRIE